MAMPGGTRTVPPNGEVTAGEDGRMSENRKFIENFAVLLAVLVLASMCLYALVDALAKRGFGNIVQGAAAEQDQVAAFIAPVGEVQLPDSSSPAAVETVAAGASPDVEPLSGAEVYEQACMVCHEAGIAGAPVPGDAQAWAPRIAQGLETLVGHAVDGFTGSSGIMPPKGGRADLSNEEIGEAVELMVSRSR